MVGLANAPATKPKRFLMIGCDDGFTEETLFPSKAGRFADIGLTPSQKPLQRHREDIPMVMHLTNPSATNTTVGK